MSGLASLGRLGGRRRELLAVLVLNATPVLGVLLLGWSLTALVMIYWFELGVTLLFAAIRAAFAQRPPEHGSDLLLLGALSERRWHLPLPVTDVGILLANAVALPVLLPVFALIWFFVGIFGLAGVEAGSAATTITEEAVLTAFVALPGLFLGRGAETYRYFADRQYLEASVQRALQPATVPIIVVGVVMTTTGIAAGQGAPPVTVVAGIVGVKIAFDLVDVYRDYAVAFDRRSHTDFGWASDAPEWPDVDTELSGPVATVRPCRRAALADGVVRGLCTNGGAVGALVIFCFGGLGLGTGSYDLLRLALLVGGSVLVAFAAFGVLDRLIRYGATEYRIGTDVVCYDRVAGRGQWRVPGWTLPRAERRRTLADRLFGTRTLLIEHDDRTVRIAHVPAESLPERVRE